MDPRLTSVRAAQEFRCPAKQNSTSWCVPRMTSWINQMASYIRSIDGNHMVSAHPVPIVDNDKSGLHDI